jgi:hypothetical protein
VTPNDSGMENFGPFTLAAHWQKRAYRETERSMALWELCKKFARERVAARQKVTTGDNHR